MISISLDVSARRRYTAYSDSGVCHFDWPQRASLAGAGTLTGSLTDFRAAVKMRVGGGGVGGARSVWVAGPVRGLVRHGRSAQSSRAKQKTWSITTIRGNSFLN